MRHRDLIRRVVALTALGMASPAFACSVSATGVAFGVYDPRGAAPTDGVGGISLSCHPSTQSPEVALGTGVSGSYAVRTMTNGSSSLHYGLYTSPAHLFAWGDGSGSGTSITLSGGVVSAGQRTFSATIYGRIDRKSTRLNSSH